MNLAQEEPALCRCCHSEGCCKDLTEEYIWMGEPEVYGDMLEETFNIKVSEYQSQENINGSKKLICKYCIMRLREAYTFRKQVLANERKLAEMLGHLESEDSGDPEVMVKMEPAEDNLKAEPEDIVIVEHGVGSPILTCAVAEPCAKPDPLLIDIDEPVSKRRRHSGTSSHGQKETTSNETNEDDYLNDQDNNEPDFQNNIDPGDITTTQMETSSNEDADFSNDDIDDAPDVPETESDCSSSKNSGDLNLVKSKVYEPQTESDDSSSIKSGDLNRVKTNITPEPSVEVFTENIRDAIGRPTAGAEIENAETQSKRKRNRDFCFYCENLVLNFARHVVRNHPLEPEVQKALSFPKKSKCRKETLTLLRKKGNYITNTQNHESFKPMKKSRYSKDDDYLPCTKCLGFYSRKQLWKHKKKCNETYSKSNAQVDAQDFLLGNVKVNEKLRDLVFPRMKPDKISCEAKKDPLICAFGLRYLRTHREDNFINVTSRKMRELSKLLIEIKKLKPNVKCLLDALKPEHFGTLVLATKNTSHFDTVKDRYGSPTYAMNIGTSIKQCCNIALLELYKSDCSINRTEIQADLKTITDLIQSHWKFDVSSQAADDLNMKKYNKTTIVPLANDLKILKEHLCKSAARSTAKLISSGNSLSCDAYNALVESVFCRIIILNRRRPGELQRLLLSEYQKYDHKDSKNAKYQEFDRVLSTTEKILVNKFKIIVIREKRGRGVPVLFSSDVQKDIDTLISVRNQYVPERNDFLFAKTGGSTVCGYKLLEKHGKSCGAKNLGALTSKRLRKHLATLTQLFHMSETDMEQLAIFMGHTLPLHKQNYRFPNDVYQTARISKLLLLMEIGEADDYKGRSLDEIELNLEEEITGGEIQNEEILDYEMEDSSTAAIPTGLEIQPIASSSTTSIAARSAPDAKKKKRVLEPWSSEQKNVVTQFFNEHIKSKKPPKRFECENLKQKYPELLKNKDWLKIKVFIQNIYTKQ